MTKVAKSCQFFQLLISCSRGGYFSQCMLIHVFKPVLLTVEMGTEGSQDVEKALLAGDQLFQARELGTRSKCFLQVFMAVRETLSLMVGSSSVPTGHEEN